MLLLLARSPPARRGMGKGENGKRQRDPGLLESWIHPPNIKRCTEKGEKDFFYSGGAGFGVARNLS